MIGSIGGRRRVAGGAVTVIEGPVSTSNVSVTFSGTPTNGDLIVLFVAVNGPNTITPPAGFSTAASIDISMNAPLACFYKLASGESSATYTSTSSGGTLRTIGYILRGQHGTPIGNTGSNAIAATATSIVCAASSINVSSGSIVLAATYATSTIAGSSYSNSFTGTLLGGGNLNASAYRAYASSATSQNTTNTWTTTATNRRGLLIEILKA